MFKIPDIPTLKVEIGFLDETFQTFMAAMFWLEVMNPPGTFFTQAIVWKSEFYLSKTMISVNPLISIIDMSPYYQHTSR